MAISRREVLRFGQVSIVCAALPELVIGADTVSDPMITMSHKSYEPLLGSTFAANSSSLSPTWLTLRLIEALSPIAGLGRTPSLQPNATVEISTEAFALHFTSVGEPLSEGTHVFQHSTLGSISLFVTQARGEYIAVINHLLAPLPATYQIPTAPAAKKA